MSSAPVHHIRRILCAVAGRPSMIRMAPILDALREIDPPLELPVVQCCQHEENAMDRDCLMGLMGLPAPDYRLDAGPASHAIQTAELLRGIEPVLDSVQPGALLVLGDLNATLACALAAAKKNIPVIHVEAGLRSFDRSQPEEINRILTDHLSDLMFTSEASGINNLTHEGIASYRVHFVGNVLIDALMAHLPQAIGVDSLLRQQNLSGFVAPAAPYALLTLQHPCNIGDPRRLRTLIETVVRLSAEVPVLFPVHPRTRAMLHQFDLNQTLDAPHIACLPPLGYLEMLGLMRDARLVLTDSGGVQEETTALGVPCLTLRNNTERPITVNQGSNAIAGRDPSVILALCRDILSFGGKKGRLPQYWDGHAAMRLAGVIASWLSEREERAQ